MLLPASLCHEPSASILNLSLNLSSRLQPSRKVQVEVKVKLGSLSKKAQAKVKAK